MSFLETLVVVILGIVVGETIASFFRVHFPFKKSETKHGGTVGRIASKIQQAKIAVTQDNVEYLIALTDEERKEMDDPLAQKLKKLLIP